MSGRSVSLLETPLTQIDTKLGLAQYASVNRDWQPIVEERSWAKLRVKTGTPLNLDQFERFTKNPRRQSYIQDIELIVELETYDEAARAHFETESENKRNNQIFSDAIRSILQFIAQWKSPQGISLSLKAQSPSDLVASPSRLRRIKASRDERTGDILDRRFERNYLRLDAFESQVAPVSIVHTLKIEALADRRQIEATSDHNFSTDDITDQGVDALSSQLHKFSQQLETLSVYGMTFGNELFWPLKLNNSHPSWPGLKTIDIEYIPSTPFGKWLFVDRSDRDEDDRYESTDSDQHDEFPEYVRTVLEDRSSKLFREVSVPGLFNELYMAVGQAALYMPKLEDLRMETESGRVYYRFRYSTEGDICASWSDRLGFQPEERVLNLWKQVASEHTGQDLTVKLCDD
ncbi:hypothetical protein PoHVEF18_000407 [Penicillium ochrochloron]